MNSQELEAYVCLTKNGQLINHVAAAKPEAEEKANQEKCRLCWHLKEHFPKWLRDYIETRKAARMASQSVNSGTDEVV